MASIENDELILNPGEVTLAELRSLFLDKPRVKLSDDAWEKIKKGRTAVERILEKGEAVYGINTGFGLLAQTRIPDDQLEQLQYNLVVSHSTGVGDCLGADVVRLIMCLKTISLSQGFSGIRPTVVQLLLDVINSEITPCIPSKGSVGASGDLAPLAHMACCLIGVGDVFYQGQRLPASNALEQAGLTPLVLDSKEGLALLNGTQTSNGLALAALFATEHCFAAAVTIGAMSVDGMQGSLVPFDARIHKLRRQPGQIAVAEKYLRLIEGSSILESHVNCDKVQDPYSLRCQPQVMGACLDLINNVSTTLQLEANAVTDNPLIFEDTLEGLSGGNFHAEPVAFAADTLALAIAEIGSISERRTALFVDPSMNGGLPAFLVANSGLNSGFMIAQVTAAALVSENKAMAHPGSVDSIPTSANQEDHVSMATYAARRLTTMAENTANILAIELLASVQAIECHQPHQTSPSLKTVVERVRAQVTHYDEDRFFAPDIELMRELIQSGYFYKTVSDILPTGN